MQPVLTPEYKKAILQSEGWSFSHANYGGTVYFRVAKDGWISVLDWKQPGEEAAIEKAWQRRQELIDAGAKIADWMKRFPNYAGIVWDDIECKFVATLFIKKQQPKEAKGDSPLLAVERWLELWDK